MLAERCFENYLKIDRNRAKDCWIQYSTLTCLINEQIKPCLINEQGDIFVENNKGTCYILPNKQTYWHDTLKTINEHRGHMPKKLLNKWTYSNNWTYKCLISEK